MAVSVSCNSVFFRSVHWCQIHLLRRGLRKQQSCMSHTFHLSLTRLTKTHKHSRFSQPLCGKSPPQLLCSSVDQSLVPCRSLLAPWRNQGCCTFCTFGTEQLLSVSQYHTISSVCSMVRPQWGTMPYNSLHNTTLNPTSKSISVCQRIKHPLNVWVNVRRRFYQLYIISVLPMFIGNTWQNCKNVPIHTFHCTWGSKTPTFLFLFIQTIITWADYRLIKIYFHIVPCTILRYDFETPWCMICRLIRFDIYIT